MYTYTYTNKILSYFLSKTKLSPTLPYVYSTVVVELTVVRVLYIIATLLYDTYLPSYIVYPRAKHYSSACNARLRAKLCVMTVLRHAHRATWVFFDVRERREESADRARNYNSARKLIKYVYMYVVLS